MNAKFARFGQGVSWAIQLMPFSQILLVFITWVSGRDTILPYIKLNIKEK
jgi:hypothetical protein